jgi:hypothetical protein
MRAKTRALLIYATYLVTDRRLRIVDANGNRLAISFS